MEKEIKIEKNTNPGKAEFVDPEKLAQIIQQLTKDKNASVQITGSKTTGEN